ncbi:MAG: hypothetical protein ABSG57_13080 [Candidatus Bathyarchaeia archaeon]
MRTANLEEPKPLTTKEKLGIALEKFIFYILKALFPESKGYVIRHPNWSNIREWRKTHGVDFRVFHGKKEVLALEVKNWRKLRNKYGLDIAQSEIRNRFHHVGTNTKITVISYADTLTEPSLNSISNDNIKIIDIGKLIGYKDFKTELFGEILHKIASVVKSAKGFSSSIIDNQSTIPSYCYVSSLPNIENKQTILGSDTTHTEEPKEDTRGHYNRFPDRRRFIDKPRFS